MASGAECGKFAVFCASVEIYKGDKFIKHVIKSKLKQFQRSYTWEDVLDALLMDTFLTDEENAALDCAEVMLSSSSTFQGSSTLSPEPWDEIQTALEFDKSLKYVRFKGVIPERAATDFAKSSRKNAFEVLMNPTQQLTKEPDKKNVDGPRFTEKDRLFNEVVDHLHQQNARFPSYMPSSEITRHVNTITNALWYLDGCKEKIMERSAHLPEVHPIPKRFLENFNGFNDWKKKRKKAPALQSDGLTFHSTSVFSLLAIKYTSTWGEMKEDLENLALAMSSYSDYLSKKNEEQQKRQKLNHPVRQVGEYASIVTAGIADIIHPKYSILDNVLAGMQMYEYLLFDEVIHVSTPFKNSMEKSRFISDIELSVPIDILTYNPGGSIGGIVFLWKVPADRDQSDIATASILTYEALKPRLPEYHTRHMRREFVHRYSNLHAVPKVPSYILKNMYAELTLDAASVQNPTIEARMQEAIISEDPDLVLDMRHLNTGRPNDTFQAFYDALAETVESMMAADERRHNVCHMSKYISIPDLIKEVSRNVPAGTPVPSESSVLFAFVPKNSHTRTSRLYKSRIQLQFKIQTRQLRTSHVDEHYCCALFKYMRHYAVKYRDYVNFICVDDKCKVDFGEPGQAISSGVRGKKSIVPVASNLSALDHDQNSKGSLTPSVCLMVDLPENEDGSFYRGEVTVSFKDSVFESSTPFRHATEIEKIIRQLQCIKPILMIYSDGGPDHRITYHSVKLALIILFKRLGIDVLIAARTAPGNSWANPAERVMSTLNLAIQNTALTRTESTSHFESVLNSANSMNDIRNKSSKVPGLKEAWLESVKPIKTLLEDRTHRLSLKEKQFKVQDAASFEEVAQLESQINRDIDPDIKQGKYQQQHLKSKRAYMQFLRDHCVERQYMFQIQKCNNPDCCTPRMADKVFPPLPDPMLDPNNKDHYRTFSTFAEDEVTTEVHRPSANNQTPAAVAEALQGIRNQGLVAQNVRKIVYCYECGKPRCIFSKKALSLRDARSLNRLLETHDYSCGCLITPEGDALYGIVSVRLAMDCRTPIEFAYYASSHGRQDVCAHCATDGAERDRDLQTKYRIVLPVCNDCKQTHEIPKRTPVK